MFNLRSFKKVSYTLMVMSFFVFASDAYAQARVATTTISISICGDFLVNEGEECDVPSETGTYSTTIVGRQCGTNCRWGPYCGDSILQTINDEECDDGNNTDNDFCAADCTEEESDAGGGSTGGGGSSSSGGRDNELGNTEVSILGTAYPNSTVNILVDAESVGTVRTNSRGEFTFTIDTDPGTTSFSFWATDSSGTRSLTINTTFDVTQGAVTTLNRIFIPPTIRVSNNSINPGDEVILSGQTAPNVTVEIMVDTNSNTHTTVADSFGNWSMPFDTGTLKAATHTVRARLISGSGSLKSESTYGVALSLFVGVEGKTTSTSDLNRDGKVNLIDFSILIFWWATPGGNSNPPADINQNGRVGLEDFSILLFNWTG